MDEIFKGEYTGRLMSSRSDEKTGMKYVVWFDYTRELMNNLQEGDLVCVPNFNMGEGKCYSILKINQIMPTHYAYSGDGDSMEGYPGFLMEAAKNLSADWTQQETESYEDVTKIICEAIPTDQQFTYGSETTIDSIEIEKESSMGMIGKDVKILSSEMTKKIFNKGLYEDEIETIKGGHLTRDEDVEVLISLEDMIKTHSGIFGFTGVGKSNLISTLINKIINHEENINIVVFDLMDEYTGLLIDLLLDDNIDSKVISIGERTLAGPILDYFGNQTKAKLEKASSTLFSTLLLPKGLRNQKELYFPAIKSLIEKNTLVLYEEGVGQEVEEFVEECWEDVEGGLSKASKLEALSEAKEKVLNKYGEKELTSEVAQEIIEELGFTEGTISSGGYLRSKLRENDVEKRVKVHFIERLEEIDVEEERNIEGKYKIELWDIINNLNSNDEASLYIVNSHSFDKIQKFISKLGNNFYRDRRRKGLLSPLTLFIFDEADQLIPQQASGAEEFSKATIEDLTRRGRKFGMGVNIATQRSTYLETSIMGQLHTYFISKLPRETDRQRVGEAFSISKDEFTQTFKFKAGEWLLISHEATGLEGVGVPIYAENAEDRIVDFLENFD